MNVDFEYIQVQCENLSNNIGVFRDALQALLNIAQYDLLMSMAKGRQIGESIVREIRGGCGKTKTIFEEEIHDLVCKGLLPNEIASHLHLVRIMGNKQHANSSKVLITPQDIITVANSLLRVLSWYYCEYDRGPRYESIFHQSKTFEVKAIRFVPFYSGLLNDERVSQQYGLKFIRQNNLKLFYFPDGFAVALLEEKSSFADPVDFLWARRQSHIGLLKRDSELTNVLHSLRSISDINSNPFIHSVPEELCYVMSVHHIDSVQSHLNERTVMLLTEPSGLGISDDPNENVTLSQCEEMKRDLQNCLAEISTVECINAGDARYFVSWSNVVVRTFSNDESDLDKLISFEISLQKIWYKLYLYCKSLDGLIELVDQVDIKQIKKEVLRTKIEFSALCDVNATGAGHLNLLREKLIETSKVQRLFDTFCQKSVLLNELERIF